MKRNFAMTIAACLLVVTMLSLCMVSSTYAKYVTSDDAQDEARVAKWGVSVTGAASDLFKDKYTDAVNGDTVIAATSGEDLVAPGTEGSFVAITIEGEPEVMVDITSSATLTLTGWNVSGTEYCPLIFTVDGTEYYINGSTITDVAGLITAVQNAITTALNKTHVAPNTPLDDTVTIGWRWEFEKLTVPAQTDELDTKLGNLATAPTVELTVSATVTQVD